MSFEYPERSMEERNEYLTKTITCHQKREKINSVNFCNFMLRILKFYCNIDVSQYCPSKADLK